MIKKLLKPHLILLGFLLFMVFCVVPSEKMLVFSLLGTCLYLFTVFFLSSKLKEANLTVIISILISAFIFICIFLFFKVNPDAYTNDQATYNTLGKTIYKYFEYGVVPKTSPEPIKLLGIKIGERNLEPTAYRPVGYPLFISLVYLVSNSTNYTWVLIAQYILHLFSLYLFYKISIKILGEKYSTISVILYTLCSPLIFVSNSFLSESLAQFLLLILIYSSLVTQSDNSRYSTILGGICGGLLVLVRPIFIVYVPILFIPPAWIYFKERKLNKKSIALAVTTGLVCILWIIRNSVLAGQLTSIATNGGINMFLGNNDSIFNGRATTWPGEKIEELIGSVDVLQNKRIEVETKIDKLFKKTAKDWIFEHPILFSRLAINKTQHLLIPHRGLFDNLEHFNNPRIDKFYLLLSYQSLYFWSLLFLVSIAMFSKKALPILLLSLPYVGMIFLSFATTRFQIPLYISASLIGALGIESLINIRKTNKTLIMVGLILFLIHFLRWKETLFEPFRDFTFRNKIVSAVDSLPDNETLVMVETSQGKSDNKYITKIFDENTYLKANLYLNNKTLGIEELRELLINQKIVTFDLDILDYLDTEFLNSFALAYEGTNNKLPYFEILDKQTLKATQADLLATNLLSDLQDTPKLVYRGILDEKSRYLFLNITLTSGSSIKIVGNEEIVLKVRPRMKKTMDLDVLIPQQFLSNGFTIFIENNSVVNDPDNISMYRDNRYMWAPTQVRINQLSVIY